MLYAEAMASGIKFGWHRGELSWTLEDNHLINKGIEATGAKRYKTHRIYEVSLQ